MLLFQKHLYAEKQIFTQSMRKDESKNPHGIHYSLLRLTGKYHKKINLCKLHFVFLM